MKRILLLCLVLLLVSLNLPTAFAVENNINSNEIEYIKDYETFVIRLREGAAERRDPFVLYVAETPETMGKIAKVDYFDLVEHTGHPYFGDAFRWEIDSPYDVTKTLISDNNEEKIYKCVITLGWKTNAEQESAVRNKIGELIGTLGITENMSDYEKTKLVYDYVCNNVKYGYTIIDGSTSISRTSYGALILGKAVCQGYSVLMYKMLNAIGIDNRIVAGTRSGESHGWNIVNIDGKYYYIDATWDAGKSSDNYQYFLKGTNSKAFANYSMFSIYQNIANSYEMASDDYIYHNCQFGEWLVVKPATCTETGLKQRNCSCGQIEEQVIPNTGHNFGDWKYSFDHFSNIRTCTNPGCEEWELQLMTKKTHQCREEDKIEGQEGCRVCITVRTRAMRLIDIMKNHIKIAQKNKKNGAFECAVLLFFCKIITTTFKRMV